MATSDTREPLIDSVKITQTTWKDSLQLLCFLFFCNKPLFVFDLFTYLYHLESRWLATPTSLGLSWPRKIIATFLGVAIAIYFHHNVSYLYSPLTKNDAPTPFQHVLYQQDSGMFLAPTKKDTV